MADATTHDTYVEDEGFGDKGEDEELEYRRLKAHHEAAGYREGLAEGEERFLQEGFNRGFIHSSRVNSCWSQLRGVLCALMLYSESEQANGSRLQLGDLLKELETRQEQEVKENMAVHKTTQVCYEREGCCVGQGRGEIAQGCCARPDEGKITQGCCIGQDGEGCKRNTNNESTTRNILQDQSYKEEQANCIKSSKSDEDHCQPHECAERHCGEGHSTTYVPSPILTELWTRCSNIARQLGIGEEELEKIRKLAGTIVC